MRAASRFRTRCFRACSRSARPVSRGRPTRRDSSRTRKDRHAHLLRHPAHRRQAPRQLHRRLPPVRRDAGAAARRFFCIVDLHSITVDYDPDDLRERTLDLAAMLFATGLDPERSTVFAQSHVTAHAEAAWLLGSVTSYGQLGRMTQFKDKADQREFVSAGALHLPGADGRRHPALPDRHRPDRRRPAAAPRARARRRRALQRALRRDVRGAARASTRRSARGSWTSRSRRRRCRRRAARRRARCGCSTRPT